REKKNPKGPGRLIKKRGEEKSADAEKARLPDMEWAGIPQKKIQPEGEKDVDGKNSQICPPIRSGEDQRQNGDRDCRHNKPKPSRGEQRFRRSRGETTRDVRHFRRASRQ